MLHYFYSYKHICGIDNEKLLCTDGQKFPLKLKMISNHAGEHGHTQTTGAYASYNLQ